jgi:hypothetical protein
VWSSRTLFAFNEPGTSTECSSGTSPVSPDKEDGAEKRWTNRRLISFEPEGGANAQTEKSQQKLPRAMEKWSVEFLCSAPRAVWQFQIDSIEDRNMKIKVSDIRLSPLQ